MTDVLLRELTNSDIDWLLAAGTRREIAAGTSLIQPQALHILLEGSLSVRLRQREVTRLEIGELVGAIPGLDTLLPSVEVSALTCASVLTVSRSPLIEKFQEDPGFMARLYRASAVLLADQLDHLTQLTSGAGLNQAQIRQAVTLFAELQDNDLDWLIAAGRVQPFPANTVLVQPGRPVDALHILLEGAVALSLMGHSHNRLSIAFSNPDNLPEQEAVRLSRGDLIGESVFVGRCPAIAASTVRESQVLSIPRWRLSAKLLHDVEFAARFYRVLAVLLANQYWTLVQRLADTPPQEAFQQLNHQLLTQVALAEARFEWMVKRVRE